MPSPINYEDVKRKCQNQLDKYVGKNSIKSLVLGVSGGLDSAVCCVLARPVCDSRHIPLIGRSISIHSNKEDEKIRARNVGEAFCTDFNECDLTEMFEKIKYTLLEQNENSPKEPGEAKLETKIRWGNLKARMRMIRLYDIARKTGGMVLSTDNLTEFSIGFWTICGDVGDFGMIRNLWKTEVYALARYLRTQLSNKAYTALQECVSAVPTDGLGVTKSDLDQLQVNSYDEADRILKTWLCDDQDAFCWDEWLYFDGRTENYEEFVEQRAKLEDHPIVQRHLRTAYKRKNPYNVRRRDIVVGRV